MQSYKSARSKKTVAHSHQSVCRGGMLVPVACVPFLPGEGGVVHQTVSVEMEPIAARLITDITFSVVSVVVPILACDEAYNADPIEAGNAELMRKRLIDGEMLFPLEAESDVTRRMGIVPMSIGGTKLTNSVSRIAHNVAVNYLRRRIYHRASLVPVSNGSLTPALLSSTAVDRFNGVLVPEERINGTVTLEGEVPIRGIGLRTATKGTTPSSVTSHQSDGTTSVSPKGWRVGSGTMPSGGANMFAELVVDEDPANPGYPNIRADFGLGTGQSLSLKQFYLAQRQDAFIRECARIIQDRPEDGEKLISRLIYGLEMDTGRLPWILFEKSVALGSGIRSAMDGANLDMVQTTTAGRIDFSRVVPRNEFGSVVITFLAVKPEEVIASQPHPVLSHPWGVVNFAADDLRIDPEPVTRRQLDSETPAGNEGDVMFWVGPNHFERTYAHFGWSRDVDPETVEHKSATWRYQVPVGVNPDNIIYPTDLDHYPFVLNAPTDPAASYSVQVHADIGSPRKLGPTPVDNLELIEEVDLFDEE